MPTRRTELVLLRDAQAVAGVACSEIVRCAQAAQAARGEFHVALSGGSTPRAIYERISRAGWLTDFASWHVWFGDERCVAPDHADSNFRMASEALLSHTVIPRTHVHRMRGEASDPNAAAADYERELRSVFATREPRFDLVLLGLGPDAHTASLFPGTAALDERSRLVVANKVDKLASTRITLTLPAINAARRAMFLVVGADKAAAVHAVLSLERPTPELPASLVELRDGTTTWLVDRAAMSRIA
jgi:6-phosphogluconolactonase